MQKLHQGDFKQSTFYPFSFDGDLDIPIQKIKKMYKTIQGEFMEPPWFNKRT